MRHLSFLSILPNSRSLKRRVRRWDTEISENDDSPDNVVLGKEGALVKNLPLDEVIRWRSTFAGITAAINNKLEWVLKLIPTSRGMFQKFETHVFNNSSLEQVDGQLHVRCTT